MHRDFLLIINQEMAGVVGLEPTNAGTKNRCLTTWLHPNHIARNIAYFGSGASKNMGLHRSKALHMMGFIHAGVAQW